MQSGRSAVQATRRTSAQREKRERGRPRPSIPFDRDATIPELEAVLVFRKQVERLPRLRPWEEVELSIRVERGDNVAWEKLVVSNLRLVFSVAERFPGAALGFADRVQAGAIGLMEAAKGFDFRMGYRFSTFAWIVIWRAIQQAIDEERGAAVGASVTRVRRVRRARRELRGQLGREATDAEIAARLGMRETDYRALDQGLQTPIHVDGLGQGVDTLALPLPHRGPSGLGPDGAPRSVASGAAQLARRVGRVPSSEPILEMEQSERYSAEEIAASVEGYLSLYDSTLVHRGRDFPLWLLVRMADLDDAIQRIPDEDYLLVYEHGLIGHALAQTGKLLEIPRSTVAYRYNMALEHIAHLLNEGRSELGQPWIERAPVWRHDLEDDYWVEEPGRSAILDAPYAIFIGPFRVRLGPDIPAEEVRTILSTVSGMALARGYRDPIIVAISQLTLGGGYESTPRPGCGPHRKERVSARLPAALAHT